MSDPFLQGLDVSHYNGAIDWRQVAAAPSRPAFAYAKATEGCANTDPSFAANRAGIRANNMLCGAYHMFHPDQPALEQARHFLAVVGEAGGDLAPMLDVETLGKGMTQAGYAQAVAAWLDAVGGQLQCEPLIYTSASFWNASLGSFAAFAAHPLWIAEYTARPAPVLPAGAATYTLWQYSASGRIAGIAGNVDLDRFNGGMAQLQALRLASARAA
jgi:lysozyme